MQEPAEPTEETKPSRGFGSYALWAGVILVLYVLSIGPVEMIKEKDLWHGRPPLFNNFYFPLFWAYANTPVQKPLGMYLHLWCPEWYDKDGKPKLRFRL